jgi:acetolactate synthase-1/2/3 large subunit
MRFPTGGELLVDCLVGQGVSHVFSIIGGQMGTIYDAIGLSPYIDVITPRNEMSAALMSCGYTATSGRPCVSMATVGAGVVYEVAGLSKAWFDYLPVVSIAPQVQSYRVKPHQESLQACNQDEIFYPITKWNSIVFHWERIPQMVDRAFREALTGIPGPTHLDIPVDILFKRGVWSEKRKRRLMAPPARSRYGGVIKGEADRLAGAAEALAAAERPVAVVGQGVGRRGRSPETGALLEELGVPVLTTMKSSGIMPVASKCNAGGLSLSAGSPDGCDLLARADLLLLLGIDRYSRDLLSMFDSPPAVIQVEADQRAFAPGLPRHCRLRADPVTALTDISGRWTTDFIGWRDEVVNSAKEIARSATGNDTLVNDLVTALKKAATETSIVVADGERAVLAAECLQVVGEYRGVYLMDRRDIRGAGLPFALGASIANPDANIILVTDKESLFYHVRELQPATCEGIGISLFVIDDGDLASNVADTESVLEGLGCRMVSTTEAFEFSARKAVPQAVLFREHEAAVTS